MSRGLVGVVLAGSLVFSSTAAMAAPSAATAATINPWAALTAMSGSAPAAALCGAAAAAAAQVGTGCVLPAVDALPPVAQNPPPPPIPVPPVEPVGSFVLSPLILALAAVAAGALIYFLVKGKGGGSNSPA